MSYQPKKAIHPGKAIERLLIDMRMTQKWLADRTGLTEKHISKMISGDASVTEDTAVRLENVLGGSAQFWANLDSNYRTTKAKIGQMERAVAEIDKLKDIPYADFVELGWVENTRDKRERVINIWRLFGVNSIEQISLTQKVAFRQSSVRHLNPYALAAWLRKGEILAEGANIPEYNAQTLKDSIPLIRELTYEAPKNFYEILKGILWKAGVVLVAVKTPKNTSVHGATRWFGRNPLIQLSIHGRNTDIMWFSLFHEIGHIILHGKREIFISFLKVQTTRQEQEANEFATEALLPRKSFDEFEKRGNFTLKAVRSFAESAKISPDIIMGRLEHEKLVPYSQFAKHHTKLCFSENE